MGRDASALRILIVEDEPTMAKLLEALLAPLGACDIAPSGAAALRAMDEARAAGKPYALVSLDIHLGDIDGREVLRHLRETERASLLGERSRARVLMSTVVDEPMQVMGAFEDQCDAYLVKPITAEKLYQRLQDLGLMAGRG